MTTKELAEVSEKPITVVRKIIKASGIETTRGRTPQNFDQPTSKKLLKALNDYHPGNPGRPPKEGKTVEEKSKKTKKKEEKKIIKKPLKKQEVEIDDEEEEEDFDFEDEEEED